MTLAEFGTGQVFWSMLWFFLFFLWIWLLIMIFGDIFRSDDLGGWGFRPPRPPTSPDLAWGLRSS